MQHFVQYVLDGLSIGSVYALVALGLVVVYRGTGHINFAQGEMALFSTLGAWWLHDKGLPLLVAIAVAAALAFVGGALIEVGLMRPAEKRSAFAPVVIAIGLFQGLNSLSGLLFPKAGQGLPFPSLFPILHSLDFDRFHPEVVCVESVTFSPSGKGQKISAIGNFLESKGYFAYADTFVNTIFCRKDKFEK